MSWFTPLSIKWAGKRFFFGISISFVMSSCSLSQLGVVNLIRPIDKSPDETHLVRVQGESEIIS